MRSLGSLRRSLGILAAGGLAVALDAGLVGCSNDSSTRDNTASPIHTATIDSTTTELDVEENLLSSGPDGGFPATADTVGLVLLTAVQGASSVTITEDNDPNDLIGRPNGYVAAVIVKDPRLEDCGSDLGVDCGVTVEEWPDSAAAKARAEYVAELQKQSPMLGSEYHYLRGPVLVRVSGELKPSQAAQYETVLDMVSDS